MREHISRVLSVEVLGLSIGLTACPQFTASDSEEPRPGVAAAPAKVRVEPRGAAERPGNAPPAPAGPEFVSARHILVQYQGSMRAGTGISRTKEEARSRIDEVLEKARAPGADFQALAREYSDGPSGPNGGELGRFGRGRMHPEFERAAFSIATDEVSEVAETPFGFHVIQRYQ